jgi:uncharacterized membrane protein YccC
MIYKHAFKTALAAVATLLVYQLLPFPANWHAAWAVIAAVVVMQANVGSSLQASWQRLIGTAVGALLGTLFVAATGTNVASLGAAVGLTVLVCSVFRLKEALRLASTTVVVIMLFGQGANPWYLGLERFIDIVIGILVALATQTLVFPAWAGEGLRQGLSQTLEKCARLYGGLFEACLKGTQPPETVRALDGDIKDSLGGVQTLLTDLKNEPRGPRPGEASLLFLAAHVQEVAEYLAVMESALPAPAAPTALAPLIPRLSALSEATAAGFGWLAQALGAAPAGAAPDLDAAVRSADEEFGQLRAAGAFRVVTTEEVLRYCTFYFTTREVAREVGLMVRSLAAENDSASGVAGPPAR